MIDMIINLTVLNEYTNKGKMNKGKLLLFCLPLHRRLAIIDISGVLSFFELVSYLKTGYLACRGSVGVMVSALDLQNQTKVSFFSKQLHSFS